MQYDACYGAAGWVAAEGARTSLNGDVRLVRCGFGEFGGLRERERVGGIVEIN